MRSVAIRLAVSALMILLVTATCDAGPIESRITTTTLTLPQALEADASSWCTWGMCSIGPRLYLAPRSDGTFLVGWTDNSGNGHVSFVSGSSISATHDFSGNRIRGLVAHDDGTYAVLLKVGATLYLSTRAANGSETWTTNLNSTIADDSSPLGDHRLAYGAGYYCAYWAVHGISGGYAGHEGDQLTCTDDSGVIQGGGWNWGCSHSMAELVGYHANDNAFNAFCSTDCYPSPPGLKMDHGTAIYDGDGNCLGSGSVQLGQMAAAETGWKVVFNAQDTVNSVAYGVGLATAGGGLTPSVVWLTNTDGAYERDPVMARIGSGTPARFLVGWITTNDGAFHLGVIDGAGTFLEGPEQLSPTGPGWGNRDDSFRRAPGGAVAWVEGASNSTTLNLYYYSDAMVFSDSFESGDTDVWSSTTP
jgi:hypothetical protein